MSDDSTGDWTTEDEDAEGIQRCIADLMRVDAGDDRFRIFDAICYLTENIFCGGAAHAPQTKEYEAWLLSRPGAAALLGYFVQALGDYNQINGREQDDPKFATTSAKREALAHAFRLVGTKGEKHQPMNERMGEDLFFRRTLVDAVDAELLAGASAPVAVRNGRASAHKEFFAWKGDVPFDETDDTHRSRMKAIRLRFKDIEVTVKGQTE